MRNDRMIAVAAAFLGLAMMGLGTPAAAVAATKDYTGQDLTGKDFRDENLNKATFDRATLTSANLGNATCKGASFRDARCQGADFRKANLEGADFTGADLKGAKFTDAKAWHAKLPGTEIYLAGAVTPDFSQVRDYRARQTLLGTVDRTNGDLSFHYADLHNTKVVGDATGVDFRGADLRGADLGKVTHLEQARLGGAEYDENTVWKIDAKKAGAVLVPAAAAAATATPKPGDGQPAPAAPSNTSSDSPFVGKWMILKGEEQAPDHGVLRIRPDHSFAWDPALSAAKPQVLTGKWSETHDGIELNGGELGQTWVAIGTSHNGKAELRLRSDKGVRRVAVAE